MGLNMKTKEEWKEIREAYLSGYPIQDILDTYDISLAELDEYRIYEKWDQNTLIDDEIGKLEDGDINDLCKKFSILPKQAVFIVEYMIDLNGAQAARRAGYSQKTANVVANTLLKQEKVARALAYAMKKRGVRTLITADAVLSKLWAIANADPGEITQVRQVCCRHCYGQDHNYQYIDESERMEVEAKCEEKNAEAPVFGGYGYTTEMRPDPACPNCRGEGKLHVWMQDTRELTPENRLIFDGVKKTREGIEVKLLDRMSALDKIAKHLGMMSLNRVEVSGPGGGPIRHEYTEDDYREAYEKLNNALKNS